MTLSVIIITYNTRAMTLDCLRALYADLEGIDAEVFVVDNASTDGTQAAVLEAFPKVRYIMNEKNVGFGAANNQGMKAATGDYFLLLNSDAFPKHGAIPKLLKDLQAQPKTGLIGPRLLNADGSLQISCFKFPSPYRAWVENLWLSAAFPRSGAFGDYRRWPHDAARNVDWIVGACILLRREVFEQVGGFDERFFMYAEESDWQLRIRDAGWDIAFSPSAEVTHLAGASGKDVSKPAAKIRINPHFFNSLDYYERKHHGLSGLLSLRIAMMIGCTMRLFLWLAASLVPRKHTIALQKARLHAWLIWRQLTTAPPSIH